VQEDLSEIRFSKKHCSTFTFQNRWATWLISCKRPVAVAIHTVLDDVKFEDTRPLAQMHKFYEFGASMRILGYHPVFVLARFLKYFTTGKVIGRKGSIYMLYYYLTYTPKSVGYDRMYDKDLRPYVWFTIVKYALTVSKSKPLFAYCYKRSKHFVITMCLLMMTTNIEINNSYAE
jgi:hypothetical protein